MSKELLIEVGPHETRVAVLEDGQVVEVQIERLTEPGVVGNIYKGRVSRVVPGIQAAFVDIGLDRDAFLFAGDLRRTGEIDSRTEVDPGQQRPEPRPIADHVQQGQELLVQVVKEPLPGKGARISPQVTVPGRFLVLLPGAAGLGISRRIDEPEQRQRLEEMVRSMAPEQHGVIVRTAGADRTEEDLRRDLERLSEEWSAIEKQAISTRAPGLVRRETALIERAARDFVDRSFSTIWVEDAATRSAVEEYLRGRDTELVDRLRQSDEEDSLFERRGVNAAITKAMRSRIWLKSGGFIVINPTEALVAIDVNSGRNTEAAELETTALETNLEAAVEVARQIRLRDLAGIIVVDFIDMLEPRNREELVAAFEAALGRDRTRIQVSPMSDFGLIAVTRKRMRGGLRQRMTSLCPCCAGEGRVKNPVTVGLDLDRALRKRSDQGSQWVIVRLNPRTRRALEEDHSELYATLLQRAGGEDVLVGDEDLGHDEFEIQDR